MKLKLILLLSIIAQGLLSFAQDILVKKNGDELKTKVLEVNISDIKYKLMDNPDGPIYMLSKSEIFMIKYENGLKEVFNTSEPSAPESAPTPSYSQTYTPQTPEQPQKINEVDGNYYQNGIRLSSSKVYRILREYPDENISKIAKEADSERKSARPLIILSIPFMSAGIMIGALSTLIVSALDNSSNTATSSISRTQIQEARNLYQGVQVVGFGMAGLGAGSLIAGITINSSASRKTKTALEAYNQTIR